MRPFCSKRGVKKLSSLVVFFVSLLTVVGFGVAQANAEPLQIQVLKPDGAPAVGAKAVLRVGDGRTSSAKPPVLTVTVANQQGIVTLDAQPSRSGSFMLDMPGCALRFMSLPMFDARSVPRTEKLAPAYILNGVTTDEKGAPLGDVEVAVTSEYAPYASGFEFNESGRNEGVITPELITRSKADGSFALRGFDFSGSASIAMNLRNAQISLLAKTRRGGVFNAGVRVFKWTAKDSKSPLRISLHPEETLWGRVFDATSGQPVPGVQLTAMPQLTSVPVDGIIAGVAVSSTPTAVTDAQGRFTVGVVRPYTSLEIYVQPHLEYFMSRVSLQGKEALLSLSGVELKVPLHRVVAVVGRTVDEQVGAPLVPVSIAGSLEDNLGGGWKNRVETSFFEQGTPVEKDGTFTLKAPAGKVMFEVRGPYGGNGSRIYQTYSTQEVEPGGTAGVKLSIARTPAVLLRWTDAPDYDRLPAERSYLVALTRTANGTVNEEVNGGPLWQLPVEKWGDALEVRLVSRYISNEKGKTDRELLPWTKFVADPKVLSDIHLPADAFALPGSTTG